MFLPIFIPSNKFLFSVVDVHNCLLRVLLNLHLTNKANENNTRGARFWRMTGFAFWALFLSQRIIQFNSLALWREAMFIHWSYIDVSSLWPNSEANAFVSPSELVTLSVSHARPILRNILAAYQGFCSTESGSFLGYVFVVVERWTPQKLKARIGFAHVDSPSCSASVLFIAPNSRRFF